MEDPLTILTYVAVVLLVGVLLSVFARKIKLPDILFFVLFGMYLGSLQYYGEPLVLFPIDFVTGIAILALVMVVFDSTSQIKIRTFDTLAVDTTRLVVTFLFVTMIFLTAATMALFELPLGLALLFSTIMAGTAPSIILPILQGGSRTIKILKFESILNTPLTVLLPFLVIDLIQSSDVSLSTQLIAQLGPFLAKFVSGIGAGIFVGIILFQTIKRAYSRIYSPLSMMIAALLSYVLAENLGGNGVLSVTTLGVFIGNTLTKSKVELLEAGSVLARSLYILVFVILGATIKITWDYSFLAKSAVLFLCYIGIRLLAITWSTRTKGIPFKEKMFMSLNAGKGIAVAVVAFALTTAAIPGIALVLDLIVIFILYSILVASVTCWSADYFLK